MKIAIVIPVYNEKNHVTGVILDIKKRLPVVVVDDGSIDGSDKLLEKVKGISFLKHKINLGKGAAMKTGAEFAFKNNFDAVIFMDSDGQHDPSELDRFIEKLEQGYEIVFGSRNYNMSVPLVRFLGNKFASVVISILFGIFVSDILCGYRALTKKAFDKMNWESAGYGVETEMVVLSAVHGLNRAEVPVKTIYHDNVKGVTMLDSIGILVNVVKWRLVHFK